MSYNRKYVIVDKVVPCNFSEAHRLYGSIVNKNTSYYIINGVSSGIPEYHLDGGNYWSSEFLHPYSKISIEVKDT